jgi:hypothetical protein
MVNVNFDLPILPRNFVTRLVQTPPAGGWPEHRELRWTQFNLAFLPRRSPADLESERCRFAFLSQPNVAASAFVGEITLGQPGVPRAQNFDRQMFDQEFSLDFARGNVVRPAHFIHSNVSSAARQDLIREKLSIARRLQNHQRRRHNRDVDLVLPDQKKRSRSRVVGFTKSTGQPQETLIGVKSIALAILVPFLFFGCGWFGPAEKYRTEGERTTYRAAEENPATRSDVTPVPQRIPGESRASRP